MNTSYLSLTRNLFLFANPDLTRASNPNRKCKKLPNTVEWLFITHPHNSRLHHRCKGSLYRTTILKQKSSIHKLQHPFLLFSKQFSEALRLPLQTHMLPFQSVFLRSQQPFSQFLLLQLLLVAFYPSQSWKLAFCNFCLRVCWCPHSTFRNLGDLSISG